MYRKIKLGKYTISEDSPCFVIAEIGHNHQGNIKIAKRLIDEAYKCGANAVKLQKRNNKKLFTKERYNRLYDNENSFGRTYGEHREFLEFSRREYKILQNYAKRLGLVFFATAFDFDSVDFLDDLDVPAYKIASADVDNIPLIEYIAKKGKPIFISTGASTIKDVKNAYTTLVKYRVPLCIMQCTAVYPLFDYKEANLNVISTYRKIFPKAIIGFSGHESGIALPIVAYTLGARVVEKHFTLNRAMKGSDHHYSLEPQGLQKMIRDLNRVYEALGDGVKRFYSSEKEAKIKMGKSIVALKRIKKGTIVGYEDIGLKSPGGRLSPSMLNKVIGRAGKKDLEWDSFITLRDLK